MTDDTKIAIEACCQATSGFGPRSVRPIGSVQSSNMDRTDRSVQALFGSVGNRFGASSISCRSGPTPSQKMSVLRIGPDRTETEPRLSIPACSCRTWQSTGYPFSLALSVILTHRLPVHDNTESFFTLEAFR